MQPLKPLGRMLVTPGVLHAAAAHRKSAAAASSGSSPRRRSTPSPPWAGGSTSARGWGLAMRGDDHHEAAFAVNVVKGLAPPDSGTVPYVTMRAVDDEQRRSSAGLGRRSRPGARVRDPRPCPDASRPCRAGQFRGPPRNRQGRIRVADQQRPRLPRLLRPGRRGSRRPVGRRNQEASDARHPNGARLWKAYRQEKRHARQSP